MPSSAWKKNRNSPHVKSSEGCVCLKERQTEGHLRARCSAGWPDHGIRTSLPTPSEVLSIFFVFNDTAPAEIYTLSLHDALPIWPADEVRPDHFARRERHASDELLARQ